MKHNPRITAKEKNLLKGGLRRVFSRSELRRSVVDASVLKGHTDPTRPRVKVWCACAVCKTPTPKSYMEVDHVEPVVPVDIAFADMSLDQFVNRVWCEENLLQALCPTCHDVKTAAENKERRRLKKITKR